MSTYPFCYLVIAVEGSTTVHRHDVLDDDVATILTDTVGGPFETITTDYPDLVFWCNEEGRLMRLPDNPVATHMTFLLGGPAQTLVGPVIVTGEASNRVNGLTPQQLESMIGLAAICRHSH